MTAVIVLRLKNPNSIIICADRLESYDKLTFFYNPNKIIEKEGKEYFELDSAYKDKFTPADCNSKIFNVSKRYIFSGSGLDSDLDKVMNKVIKFVGANKFKKNLIKHLKNYITKDFVNKKLYDDDTNKFILIDTKFLKIHYFDIQTFLKTKEDNDLYKEINEAVFLFGDLGDSEIADVKVEFKNPLEVGFDDKPELLFNKFVLAMNRLSIRQPRGTIGSPFVYGLDLWHIKKKGTNKYKLKTNFRWEND